MSDILGYKGKRVIVSGCFSGMGEATAKILLDLGVRQLRLLTNNPRKVVGLDGYGLRITERVPLQVQPNESNRRYLETKKDKMGHMLE